MTIATLSEDIRRALNIAGIIDVDGIRAVGITGIAKLPGMSSDGIGKIALLLAETAAQPPETAPALAQIDAGEAEAPDDEDDTAPIPVEETVAPGREFTTRLQDRHANWVENMAEFYNSEPGKVIEQCVRRAYAEDSTKAGTAGGGTVKADEFDGGEE